MIAQEHGLQARCHLDLAAKPTKLAEQAGKSDMQFLRDLGCPYDASAVAKAGILIFAPKGAPTTAGDKAMPEAVLVRSRCSSIDWKRAARDRAQDAAEAQWHDKHETKRKTHCTSGNNRKRLKRTHACEADAKAATEAETKRFKRAAATLSASLAWGNPLFSPE